MILRKFILAGLIPLLCLTCAHGQVKADKTSAINHIRQVFRQISGYNNYRIITIDDSEEFLGHGTDNGGSLKGYYKGDSLKKIVEWVGLSNRVVTNEYYLDKGDLVFVFSTDSRCKSNVKTGEIDCSKFDKVLIGRYYFSKGKLIDAILSDKEHEMKKFEDAATLLMSSKDYIKLLNAKR